MRLANQRQKIEEEQEALDKLTEQELMAYEVARETLGEDVAYNLQMDNPLPAARMRPVLNSSSTVKGETKFASIFCRVCLLGVLDRVYFVECILSSELCRM